MLASQVPRSWEVDVRNLITGRQCYGGMKPVDMIEDFEPSDPLPPPPPIPEQPASDTNARTKNPARATK